MFSQRFPTTSSRCLNAFSPGPMHLSLLPTGIGLSFANYTQSIFSDHFYLDLDTHTHVTDQIFCLFMLFSHFLFTLKHPSVWIQHIVHRKTFLKFHVASCALPQLCWYTPHIFSLYCLPATLPTVCPWRIHDKFNDFYEGIYICFFNW